MAEAGVALDENGKALANMGLALGDYLHTGYPSIAITHFSEQYLELFRNDGKLSFTLDFEKHESIDVTGTLKDGKLAGEFHTEGFTDKWEAKKK